jgi:hypothetical protein
MVGEVNWENCMPPTGWIKKNILGANLPYFHYSHFLWFSIFMPYRFILLFQILFSPTFFPFCLVILFLSTQYRKPKGNLNGKYLIPKKAVYISLFPLESCECFITTISINWYSLTSNTKVNSHSNYKLPGKHLLFPIASLSLYLLNVPIGNVRKQIVCIQPKIWNLPSHALKLGANENAF